MVDVRANVRLTTRYFLEKFPAFRLVCVKPEPPNVRLPYASLHIPPAVVLPPTLVAATGLATINPTYGPATLSSATTLALPSQQLFQSPYCYNRSI